MTGRCLMTIDIAQTIGVGAQARYEVSAVMIGW
jgi:hypothetical protein